MHVSVQRLLLEPIKIKSSMSATAIPHASLPLRATDTILKGGAHAYRAMAEITFAVVSLASSIPAVATLRLRARRTYDRQPDQSLALQLLFAVSSESMGHHDSEIMDDRSID